VRVLIAEKSEDDVEKCKEEGQEVPEEWYCRKWIRYFVDQEGDEPLKTIQSEKGECIVTGLFYKPNDDLGDKSLSPGSFEMIITDVTQGLPPRLKMKKTVVLLKLVDLDTEAAAA
jgi:hypothetical protein